MDRATASLLYVAGAADHNYTTVELAEQAADILTKAGKVNYEVKVIPGLGHMCNLPFSPPQYASVHPLAPAGMKIYMGGADTPLEHQEGQMEAWHYSLRFLDRELKGLKAKL